MTDFLVSQSQDGDAQKASYSFGFKLDSGSGPVKNVNIDVMIGEAADIGAAFELAKQRAADSKQDWVDSLTKTSLIGAVSLPPPTKKDKISDVSAIT